MSRPWRWGRVWRGRGQACPSRAKHGAAGDWYNGRRQTKECEELRRLHLRSPLDETPLFFLILFYWHSTRRRAQAWTWVWAWVHQEVGRGKGFMVTGVAVAEGRAQHPDRSPNPRWINNIMTRPTFLFLFLLPSFLFQFSFSP